MRTGSLPVWSATTCAPFPSAPQDVRDLVVRHLLEPVRFRELTLRLYEKEGVRSFVTLGPGSLPGFVEDTLRDRPHLSVAVSSPRLDGLPALRRACAALWSEGHAPDWKLLAEATAAPCPAGPPAPRPAGLPGAADVSGAADVPGALGGRPGGRGGAAAGGPGRSMPLDLGSPLVRIGEAARASLGGLLGGPAVDRARPAGTPPASAPQTGADRPVLLTALDAVLADTGSAARAVTEAWSAAGAAKPPAETPAQAPAAAPAQVQVPAAAPAQDVHGSGRAAGKHTLHLSLATQPSVRDHCVYLQPDGWPEDSDRFPVVPMTTMLELAAEAARRYASPGLAVLGYEDVRALVARRRTRRGRRGLRPR